ncbi:MAG: hypothetical protein FAF05_02280 [Epsilonproteobacteria bacterium]|nr:hypothetical protein [Campylobacterota bacterium]
MENMQQTIDIPLHDIKPLVEIQEYSLYYFIALVVLGVVVLMALGYLFYRYFQTKKRYNQRKEHKKMIEQIDLQNTKRAAYDLTYYGTTFADDSPRHRKYYDLMVEHLAPYKYKKNVEDFDDETLRHIGNYKEMLDV